MDLKLRCPKCKSSQTRFRIKTKDRICYTCGNIFKLEENKTISEDKE